MTYTLSVLVPKPGTHAAQLIDAGSGIVTDPSTPVAAHSLLVYYESNRYGHGNIVTFEDKVVHAAGRLDRHYPTIACGVFQSDQFDVIGTFTFAADWSSHALAITDQDTLTRWQTKNGA